MDAMRKGAQGLAVQELQTRLNSQGARLRIDGWYGDATEAAVAKIQSRAGLVVDGIAGPKTLAILRGDRDPRRLGEADLRQAAGQLNLELAAVKALNEVASSGSGFLPDGRPVILLERHLAYRQALKAGLDARRIAERYPDLCNPARGGYAGAAPEWERYRRLSIVAGEDIAIESCSWGAFQITGLHWRQLGYLSCQDFKSAMESSEAAQLETLARLIRANPPLHLALQGRQWQEVARLYNGPAYRENLYDSKLAAAYARARKMAACPAG